jgi:hypothetical protein
MTLRHHIGSGWIAILLIAAVFSGCTALPDAVPFGSRATIEDRIVADLTPDIEALYLAWHELDQIYKDIKFLERGFLFDPNDRQLGYIQKAGLYIQDASVRIHHQWQQLSVLHYIRPEMMRDYLTICVKGLTSAIVEIGYDQMFMKIYGVGITHHAVTADLNRARSSIEKNNRLINGIRDKLLPLANPAGPRKAL